MRPQAGLMVEGRSGRRQVLVSNNNIQNSLQTSNEGCVCELRRKKYSKVHSQTALANTQ